MDILKDEITNDPLGRGYSGMSDEAVSDDLNTKYRSQVKLRMEGTEVLNSIDKAEYSALSETDKDRVWQLLHLGSLNPSGIEADLLIDIFGGGSTTITDLQAARIESISRASELNIGQVKPGHVEEARR